MEKDWSFLETDDSNSEEVHKQKISRIISAGEIQETSRVMVSTGSEAFVDQIVNSLPSQLLLLVHDSLLVLACIKEKYDMVKCWQGEIDICAREMGTFRCGCSILPSCFAL